MPTYDCGDFETRILDYETLSDLDRRLVDVHVAGCVSCGELLGALQAVDFVLSRSIPELTMPERPTVLPLVLDFAGWTSVIAALLVAALAIWGETAAWLALGSVVVVGSGCFGLASWKESAG